MLDISILMKRKQVNVRLNEEQEAQLQRLIERTGHAKASLVKKYLLLGMEWEEKQLEKFSAKKKAR
jgi:predicted DNA-binding protein